MAKPLVYRRRRPDANHKEIGRAFRNLGWTTVDIHGLPGGPGDYIVGRLGVNLLIEVKDGNKPPSARRLSQAEQVFHETWRGAILVVESVGDVVELTNRINLADLDALALTEIWEGYEPGLNEQSTY